MSLETNQYSRDSIMTNQA